MILNTYFDIAQTIASEVPNIIWRDMDKGQLDNPEKYNSLILPAILIGFSKIEWETFGQHSQLGEGTVTLKLVVRLPAETHDIDPLFRTNLDEIELASQVDQAMRKLERVRGRIDSDSYPVDTFYVIEQTYPISHVPDPPRYKRVPVQVSFNPQIQLP